MTWKAFIHLIWQVLTICIGIYVGYTGLLHLIERRRIKIKVYGEFDRKKHVLAGVAFNSMLVLGMVCGFISFNSFFNEIERSKALPFSNFHLSVALLIVPIYIISAFIGFPMAKGNLKYRKMHASLNYTACFFVVIQVILGLLLAKRLTLFDEDVFLFGF